MPDLDPHYFDMFYEIFEGRDDAVLVDPPRQLKLPDEDGCGVDDYLMLHLQGRENIGIYCLRDGKETRWICTDLDTEESESQAWDLVAAWEYYGIQAWVETSRSKGHHVWVFIDDWVSGTIARRAGLFVHSLAQVPATELNPKQELVEGYGNCVRLPYPKKQHGTYRQCMWHSDKTTPYSLEEWLPLAHSMLADPDTLQRLAQMWTPPPSFTANQDAARPASEWDPESTFNAKEVFNERADVPEGNRDNTFFVLACYMKAREFEREEAMSFMKDIWETQTENHEDFPWKQVAEKVNRVYGWKR